VRVGHDDNVLFGVPAYLSKEGGNGLNILACVERVVRRVLRRVLHARDSYDECPAPCDAGLPPRPVGGHLPSPSASSPARHNVG